MTSILILNDGLPRCGSESKRFDLALSLVARPMKSLQYSCKDILETIGTRNLAWCDCSGSGPMSRAGSRSAERFADFVPHPRFGTGPRYTDLNPTQPFPHTSIPWNSRDSELRIVGTAIAADPSRQVSRPVQRTHYFDIIRTCRDCQRQFLFFAEEQKFWYEDLQFAPESEAIRCCECRAKKRKHPSPQARYSVLAGLKSRTLDESEEMLTLLLELIEQGRFSSKHTNKARQLLNLLKCEGRPEAQLKIWKSRIERCEGHGTQPAG